MKRYCFLIVFLLALAVVSYAEPLEIRGFKGLDTRTGDKVVDPSYSRVAHNPDFSRTLGEMSKRRGYAFVDSLPWEQGRLPSPSLTPYDSLTTLYAAYLSDGTQCLIFGADLDGYDQGYSTIYKTGYGSALLDTPIVSDWEYLTGDTLGTRQIYDYWNPQVPTSFMMFNDIIYGSNGVQRGFAADLNKSHSAQWPLPAPGEPRVAPIAADSSIYYLRGEYRYVMRMRVYSHTGGTPWYVTRTGGKITSPVKVDGHVLLTDFSVCQVDTLATTVDSVKGELYRTKANPGSLDDLDKFWRVGHGDTIILRGTDLNGIVFIDSIPDDSLGDDTFRVIDMRYRLGRDSAYAGGTNHRYGAPSFFGSTDSAWNITDTAKNFIWGGSPGANLRSLDTNLWPLAYVYTNTLYDTLLKIESDTSRSLFVFEDTSDDKRRTIRLAFSSIPDSIDHVVRRLYRATLNYIGRDTAVVVYSSSDQDKDYADYNFSQLPYQFPGPRYSFVRWRCGTAYCYAVYLNTITRDSTALSPFIMVDEFTSDSVYYTDSVRTDSLFKHKWYMQTVPPPFLTSIFGYGNYIFGVAGSRLYQSKQDSASFGAFSFVSVNEDDGDMGTLARPTRTAIRFYKNNSRYNVYEDKDGAYRRYEIVDGVGCIAPQSGVLTPYGFVFLSKHGVILENDGEYLERTVRTGKLSERLSNFDNMDVTARSKARGAYVDNKYMLYVPAPVDSMFVYDFLADAWATWSIDISGSTLYGTEATVSYLTGDTLFFYGPNSRVLYKFPSGETDAGSPIETYWKSVPLLATGDINTIQQLGVWTTCADSTNLTGSIFNESGVITIDGSSSVLYSSDMSDRYQKRGVRDGYFGLYFQLYIAKSASSQFSLGGIDITWRRFEEIMNGPAH